jgi:hypothetical protein
MTSVSPSDTSPISTPASGSSRAFVRALELVALGGLGVTAWIHFTEMSGKYSEVPYLGVGYGLLVVACLVAAIGVFRGDRRGWILAGLATAATIAGFTLTRTTGLPGSMDDIGNWSEKIAIYSLIAEGVVVAVSGFVLVGGHHRS